MRAQSRSHQPSASSMRSCWSPRSGRAVSLRVPFGPSARSRSSRCPGSARSPAARAPVVALAPHSRGVPPRTGHLPLVDSLLEAYISSIDISPSGIRNDGRAGTSDPATLSGRLAGPIPSELEDLLGQRPIRAAPGRPRPGRARRADAPTGAPGPAGRGPHERSDPVSTMDARPAYGEVASISASLINRRSFMRRMLGAGVGLLSLEFLGGTIAFLWPGPAEGMGVEYPMGTLDEINAAFPDRRRASRSSSAGARVRGKRPCREGDGDGPAGRRRRAGSGDQQDELTSSTRSPSGRRNGQRRPSRPDQAHPRGPARSAGGAAPVRPRPGPPASPAGTSARTTDSAPSSGRRAMINGIRLMAGRPARRPAREHGPPQPAASYRAQNRPTPSGSSHRECGGAHSRSIARLGHAQPRWPDSGGRARASAVASRQAPARWSGSNTDFGMNAAAPASTARTS